MGTGSQLSGRDSTQNVSEMAEAKGGGDACTNQRMPGSPRDWEGDMEKILSRASRRNQLSQHLDFRLLFAQLEINALLSRPLVLSLGNS